MVLLGSTALGSPAAPGEVEAQENYMYYEREFSEMPEYTTVFQQVGFTDTS